MRARVWFVLHRLSSRQPRCLLRTGWPSGFANGQTKVEWQVESFAWVGVHKEDPAWRTRAQEPLPHSSFASCPAAHRLTLYPPAVIDVTHIFDRSVRAERTKADLRAKSWPGSEVCYFILDYRKESFWRFLWDRRVLPTKRRMRSQASCWGFLSESIPWEKEFILLNKLRSWSKGCLCWGRLKVGLKGFSKSIGWRRSSSTKVWCWVWLCS